MLSFLSKASFGGEVRRERKKRLRRLRCYDLCRGTASHPLSSPFFPFSLLVVTQIRGHVAGSSPSFPRRFVPCIYIAYNISDLSSLVGSRRTVPTHARRSQHLILFLKSLPINSESHHGGIHSNSRINTVNSINSSIRGLPLYHRGDRH